MCSLSHQALKILAALRSVCDKDLPETVDPTIFNDAKVMQINVLAIGDLYVLNGDTYPLIDFIKELGFTYSLDVDGMAGVNRWTIPQESITVEEIEAVLDEWGWDMIVYDNCEQPSCHSSATWPPCSLWLSCSLQVGSFP